MKDALAKLSIRHCTSISSCATVTQHTAYLPRLPSFFRMYSPRYRTPFCLYGSGGRLARMEAANWPTCSLSYPVIVTLMAFSTCSGRA